MVNKATEESRCCPRRLIVILHGSSGDCENAAPDNVENSSNDVDCDGDFTTTLPRGQEDHHNGGWNAALALAL